jgi:uncharacterized RDD family membrane protein YckC
MRINQYIVYLSSFLGYYFLTEYFFGKTIGKIVTGSKVIIKDHKTKRIYLIIVRTLCRFIPLEPFSVFLNEDGKMWHDKLSSTEVVDS